MPVAAVRPFIEGETIDLTESISPPPPPPTAPIAGPQNKVEFYDCTFLVKWMIGMDPGPDRLNNRIRNTGFLGFFYSLLTIVGTGTG